MRPVCVIIRLCLAGSIAWMLPASAFCDEAFPEAALGSLTSEEYKDRVQAQRDLMTWAEGRSAIAEERLLHEHDAATDPEVRLRLREVLRDVVVAEFQRKEGQGYVGIQMDDRNVQLPGGDEQRGGVGITWIHPDTPAMKAGLQVNDVVVALNDLRWTEGMGAREGFAAEIRRHKPGDKVSLEILRGNDLKKIELTLGARPLGLDEAMKLFLLQGDVGEDPTKDLRAHEKLAKEAYFERWLAAKRADVKKP